jgi:hypothetical protein
MILNATGRPSDTAAAAADIAFQAAQVIKRAGHQPAGLDGYAVAAGQEF